MGWISAGMHVWFGMWQGQALAALISLGTLRQALANFGYPAVVLFVMIESAGIPMPGETILLLASFYAAIDNRLQIPVVIACAALGAILGDNFGYFLGRVGGRPLVERFGRYFFVKPKHLDYAERFFARHGGKTVFFGRFTTILRIWAAFLAGMHHMNWRTFLVYNAAGGILWSMLCGAFGYIAGKVFHDNFDQIQQLAHTIGWITGGIIVAVFFLAVVVVRWRLKQRMQKELEAQDREKEPDPVK